MSSLFFPIHTGVHGGSLIPIPIHSVASSRLKIPMMVTQAIRNNSLERFGQKGGLPGHTLTQYYPSTTLKSALPSQPWGLRYWAFRLDS